MRPIDADALKESLLKERDKIPLEIVERYSFGCPSPNKHGQSMRGGIRKALRCMENTPTLDYAPVKHGEWIYKEPCGFEGQKPYVCSGCGLRHPRFGDVDKVYFPFCPWCGTPMGWKEDASDENA